MKSQYGLLAFMLMILSSCVEPIHDTFSKLPPGEWRGVLVMGNNPDFILTDKEVIEKTDFSGDLPFNFEIVYDTEEVFHVEIRNGEEIIILDSIDYGRDRKTAKDTITIHFNDYQTYIKAIYEENIMEGHWYVPYRTGSYRIPFKAYQGQNHRFSTTDKEPITDLTGRWETTFSPGTEDAYPAIGEFVQKGNNLRGTFMTETGDFRFLEGNIEENKFSLSAFDGTHAFLFEGKVMAGENKIIGGFKSGTHYETPWEATRNESVELKDAFSLTGVVDPDQRFNFSFPDLEGNLVSLDDEQFQDEIKLIKISGTWCPNCKDEMNFLRDYLKENPSKDVELVEISFETSKDDERNINTLKRYQKTIAEDDVTLLYGGRAVKTLTSEKLPQLTKILSYPTLIFVDKHDKIRYVHTGFAGPATSGYEPFKQKFSEIMEELKSEI